MSTGKRFAIALVVALVLVSMVASVADAKSLTVKVTPDNWQVIAWNPHVNSGVAHVYGPNGYYRAFWFSWATRSITYGDAPGGAYRVRYCFSAGWDSGYQEKNTYPTINWWEWGDTSSVSSP